MAIGQTKGKLLIVDDENAILKAYVRALSTNYEVETASTLETAIAMIDRTSYDSILTDLQLTESGEEGYQIIKYARKKFPKASIILNSSACLGDVEKIALESGASHVLKKPVLLKELKQKLAVKCQ
jgi:DNA-binding response OmpR family regulator